MKTVKRALKGFFAILLTLSIFSMNLAVAEVVKAEDVDASLVKVNLVKDTFQTGVKSKIEVNVAYGGSLADLDGSPYLYLVVNGPDSSDSAMAFCSKYITSNQMTASMDVFDEFDYVPLVFEKRGKYTVDVSVCCDSPRYEYSIATLPFTVKALADEDGNRIIDQVKMKNDSFKIDEKSSVSVEYGLANPDHTYYLFVIDPMGQSVTGTNADYKQFSYYIVGSLDWHSDADELDTQPGKLCEKTFKYKFTEAGKYGVVLYDKDNEKAVAQTTFTVSGGTELGVDESKVVNGKMPFEAVFKGGKTHLDLDSDDTIQLDVQLPFDYKKAKTDIDKEYEQNQYRGDIEDLKPGKTSPTTVKVLYQPAGTTETRELSQAVVFGYFDSHTFKYNAQDILTAIENTVGSDIAYAGIVTVQFSGDGDGGYYQNAFTESASFSVSKKAVLKNVSVVTKSTPLAYGEAQGFYVEDTLGGNIDVTILKGKKKVGNVTGSCTLGKGSDANAYGYVYWNLANSSNKYVKPGKYKAKIYTYINLTTLNDGKKETKNIKSKAKTVKFKVVKPKGTLKLESVPTGLNGGEYVTYENPMIGIENTVTIGSEISVKIQNTNGTVIKNDSFVQKSGTATRWYDLQKLDSNLSLGTYTATVTATTMQGKTATNDISFSVEKSPKVEISNASLNVNDGVGDVSFTTSQSSKVDVVVTDSKGNVLLTVLSGQYSAGTIRANFTTGSYTPGDYSVEFTATNSGGTSTAKKTFTIEKKPVIVTKPTVSGLSIRYTQKNNEDAYQVSCGYTGKGAKVVIEIMWNDAEQIVETYQYTTTEESGTVSWVWDGYKSNGFRATTGSYTVRAYAVNSAGQTDYLRQAFTISEG